MRLIIPAVAAVFTVSLAIPTPSLAASNKQSLDQSINACISLARARGYSTSDADTGRARNFVISCLRKGTQRAQR